MQINNSFKPRLFLQGKKSDLSIYAITVIQKLKFKLKKVFVE